MYLRMREIKWLKKENEKFEIEIFTYEEMIDSTDWRKYLLDNEITDLESKLRNVDNDTKKFELKDKIREKESNSDSLHQEILKYRDKIRTCEHLIDSNKLEIKQKLGKIKRQKPWKIVRHENETKIHDWILL